MAKPIMTQGLETRIIGGSPHQCWIPIRSPLHRLPISTLKVLRLPQAEAWAVSSTTKQETCILQAWDFSWAHPSRYQVLKTTQILYQPSTCMNSIHTCCTRSPFRVPILSHNNSRTRLALSCIKTLATKRCVILTVAYPVRRWKKRKILRSLQTSLREYTGICPRRQCNLWKSQLSHLSHFA